MKGITSKIIKTIFIAFVLVCTSVMVQAQIDASNPSGRPKKEEFPQQIQETLAKKRIEDEKKDHQQLLERGEEAVKLSEELESSYGKKNQLSSDDQKKLKQLEKLLKKIRSDLGGDDDDEEFEEKPASKGDALINLKENTLNLLDQIKVTSRHTISAVAIESTNMVIKIVKFLRFKN